MDAYDIFDRKHEQYSDDQEEAVRWKWEIEHKDNCPMDRTALIRNPNYTRPVPCCLECWKRVWSHEGAQLIYQHRRAA